jgi:hypothetical protein
MDPAPSGVGEMCQLVDEKTLSGAGKSREEDEPSLTSQGRQRVQQ